MTKLIKGNLYNLPGLIVSSLMILFTLFWTFWGTAEMYHEGWWGAWYNRLPYLVPIILTLIPTIVAFKWPIVGGIVISCVGLFALFFFSSGVSVIGLTIALVGSGFIVDALIKRRTHINDVPLSRWHQHWRSVTVISGVIIIFIVVSMINLPVVLTRIDDGDRGARLIEGPYITLIWAPEGPGWNWKQPWGGYPAWQKIALYGIEPVGFADKSGYGKQSSDREDVIFASTSEMNRTSLCAYLSNDGTTMMDTPQNIWRMPTTSEVVWSLGRHGESAGCIWRGEFREQVFCDVLPDKESPLWATDVPVIYYWTAEEYSERQGHFVAYNGTVNASYKLGGNPRHGYRCVREP